MRLLTANLTISNDFFEKPIISVSNKAKHITLAYLYRFKIFIPSTFLNKNFNSFKFISLSHSFIFNILKCTFLFSTGGNSI